MSWKTRFEVRILVLLSVPPEMRVQGSQPPALSHQFEPCSHFPPWAPAWSWRNFTPMHVWFHLNPPRKQLFLSQAWGLVVHTTGRVAYSWVNGSREEAFIKSGSRLRALWAGNTTPIFDIYRYPGVQRHWFKLGTCLWSYGFPHSWGGTDGREPE